MDSSPKSHKALKMFVMTGFMLVVLAVIVYVKYQQLPNYNKHKDYHIATTPGFAQPDSLLWLKRHQANDGSWRAGDYQFFCGEHKHGPSNSVYNTDLIYTGLACLCYLSAGYDHKLPGGFKKVVGRGLDWLLAQQTAAGVWSDNNYEQAIVSMTINEAYAMTMDKSLKEAAEKSVQTLSDRAVAFNHKPKLITAWNRNEQEHGIIDLTLFTWCVMACKSNKVAGFNCDRIWEEAKISIHHINELYINKNKKTAHVPKFIDTLVDIEYAYSEADSDIGTAMIFLGYKQGDPDLDILMNKINTMTDRAFYNQDPHSLYKSRLCSFQFGGKNWVKFNERTAPLFSLKQNNHDCSDGSYNPDNHNCDSRFEATVFFFISTQIYDRWPRLKRRP